MAAIDSLLKILAAQGGDAMLISSGKAPVLRRGDESVPFSMPPLQHDLVVSFLEGIVDERQLAAVERDQTLDAIYTAEGNTFAVHVARQGATLTLDFRRTGGRRAAADPSPPSVVAVPAAPEKSQVALAAGGVAQLLMQAEAQRASDILLSCGVNARLRIGGSLVEIADSVGSDEQILELLQRELTPAHRSALEASGSADVALEIADGAAARRYRVNLFRQQRGLAVVLRPVRREVPTLRQLNLPDELVDLVGYSDGLVLVAGPAGSGKSTTVVALIEHLNQTRPRHVITLENPIEYLYTSKRALIHQREVGREVESFSAGLRDALRESPDVILLGEMRDLPTISAALTAAETGQLVISTLHSGSAATAIDRIIDVYPAHQQGQVRSQLAAVLRAVLTQVLVPSSGRPPRMVPAYEKMIVSHAVAAKIREDRCHQLATEIQTGRAEGMVSLEQSLAALVRTRQVELDVARAFARDPAVLEEIVRGR
jgi:twitching motility protein PilT